jgi:hypothetical protein
MANLLSTTVNGALNSTGRITASYDTDRYQMNFYRASASNWWVTNDSGNLGFHLNNVGDRFYFGTGGDFWSSANGWLSTALAGKLSTGGTAANSSQLEGFSAYGLVVEARGTHSGSDFVNGTLVQTDINADGWAGNSFVMEVSGKSYGSGTPFKLIMEGYLYADTIINVSAMSYGSYFPAPVKVMRYNGNVAFWWPRGSYWNSFLVHVRSADGESWNRVTSISDSVDPASADKKISITPVQVIHTNNIGSQSVNYATTAGDASTLGGFGRGNTTNKIAYFDGSRNLFVNDPETYVGEVRLGAAWGRGGVYASSTLSLSTNGTETHFVFGNSVPIIAFSSGQISTGGSTDRPINITGAANKYITINPGNGYEAMVNYVGGSGLGWYVGKRMASQVVGTESFHFYSEAASQTVGGIDTGGNMIVTGSMRAPIFYDSNDTTYYGDFASLSRVNEIGANKMRADTNGTFGTDLGWWSHDPYGQGWGKPHGSFRSLEVSSSGDFSNEPAMFRIHQWGSGAAEFWKPKGTILYLRETPGGGSTWFTKFEVQGSQNITGFLNVNGATEHTANDNGSVVHGTTTNNRVFINGSIQLTNNNDAIVIGRGAATFLTDEELGFGWGGGWYMTEGSYMRSRGNKSLHMNGGSVDYVGSLYLEGSVGVHLQPNSGSYGSLQVTGSKDGWHGIRFTGSNVVVMANGGEVGFHNNNAGWQFRWASGEMYISSGSSGGGTERTVIHSGNIGSQSVSYAGNSGALGGLGVGSFLRDDGWNNFPGQDANTQGTMRSDFTYSNNSPWTGELIRFGASGYSLQLNAAYQSSNMSFRTVNGDNGTYNAWREFIHSGNIASQSVNYADESGYSGSSGSVEWANVQNKPATFPPSAHNHDDRYYTESESDTRYAYKEGSSGTNFYANAYYQYEWTRIMGSGSKGIYWQEGDGAYWHIYPRNQADMRFRTGSGNGGIVGTVADETARGYIHWTTSNEIGFLSEDRNWVLRTYNRGVEVYGELRAPIFYDSSDTTFYVDPNSSSRVRNLYVGDGGSNWSDPGGWGTQLHVSNGPHSIIRVYARNEGIETGMFSHTGGQSKVGSFTNHDFSIVRNFSDRMIFYSGYTYANGYLQAADSLRAPIFYDSNDTTYYLDPNGGAYLRGRVDVVGGHGNSSFRVALRPEENGIGTGVVTLQSWCSEPGNSWDGAGFGYNVDNNSNTNAPSYHFGRPNPNFGQAFMRMFPDGAWRFYNATTGAAFSHTMTLSSDGHVTAEKSLTSPSVTSLSVLVNNHSDNTRGYRIHNTSGSSVSAMFTNSANALVIGAGAFDQVQLNKKVLVSGAALGVNVAASATAGRIDASNDIVAYSSSDERLKHNITPIENALDKVKSLTGVEFDWKPEYKHAHGYEGHDTGIIAQQVQEVIPSAVRTNDTGFLAVRYEKLIGLLIEANKELAARVEELEKKLG